MSVLKKQGAVKEGPINGWVLVDTCAWIEFLRDNESALGDRVSALIEQERAVMCGVVVTELRQGLKLSAGKRNAAELSKLELLFQLVPCLPTTDRDWHSTGECLQQLRSQGITVPLTDALIAAIAKRCQVQVLTYDAHFKALGFEVFS